MHTLITTPLATPPKTAPTPIPIIISAPASACSDCLPSLEKWQQIQLDCKHLDGDRIGALAQQ